MGKTLYEIMKPEIDEAREEGIKEGIKEGILKSLLQSIKSLMKNLNINMEQAMNSLSVEPEYRSKLIAMMNK